MSASQSGVYNTQQFTDMGAPLVGGRLYTYAFGTTTHKTAFTDHAGAIPHAYTADGLGGQFIALDARGELPAPLYLTGGSYDLALKTAAGATVWTRRADPVWDITSDLSASSGASLVGYIPAGLGAIPSTVSKQLGVIRSVLDFGADPTGATDSTPAFNLAVASGVDFVPDGTYLLMGTSNGDGYYSGVVLPFKSGSNIPTINKPVALRCEKNVILKAGRANMIVIRMAGERQTLSGCLIDGNGFSNVISHAHCPESLLNTTVKVSQQYNTVRDVAAQNCYAYTMCAVGPTISGSDSGSFYHTWFNPTVLNCTVGWWMKEGASTTVLTTRCDVFGGRMVSGNTAVIANAVETLNFYGTCFENLSIGTSPSATPNVITMPQFGSGMTAANGNIKFIGGAVEASPVLMNVSVAESVSFLDVALIGCATGSNAATWVNNSLKTGSRSGSATDVSSELWARTKVHQQVLTTAGTYEQWNSGYKYLKVDNAGVLNLAPVNGQVFIGGATSAYQGATCVAKNNVASPVWSFGPNTGGSFIVNNAAGVGVYMPDGGSTWNASSDERLKDIIEPITGALAKLSALRTVIGCYKSDAEKKRRSFVIAQDVESVFPEAVTVNNDDIQSLGVGYTDLIPLIIAAINELSGK